MASEPLLVAAAIAVAVALVLGPAILAWSSATGRLEAWWRREAGRPFPEMSGRARAFGELLAAFMIAQILVGVPFGLLAAAIGLLPSDLLPVGAQVAVVVVFVGGFVVGIALTTVRMLRMMRASDFFG